MKHLQTPLRFITVLLAASLAVERQFHAAWIVLFVGLAAAHSWTDYRPGYFATNTIDSELQLTTVLDTAMRAIKRRLLPLLAFSTVFRGTPLKGNDKIAVPFYPLHGTGTSSTRAANGSYKALAENTSVNSKVIENFTNQTKVISFNSRERARQPQLNPEMHGMLMGEALAYDVIKDIFKVVRAADFNGDTISAVTSANFDENDVADLRKLCADGFWPDSNRSLILNPAYATNLLKQGQIIDASKRGDGGASFREGVLNRILGFDIFESAGLHSNTDAAVTLTSGEADDDTITATAHGLAVGDRIIFPTLTGGTGITAATVAYFVKTVPTANTFTISATAGGATLNFTADITAGTVRKYEDIQGIAVLPSAILVAFVPVIPTDGVREKLVDYREITDESGLTLQYKRLAYEDTDEEAQAIECHYGFEAGDTAQLKIIRSTLA